MSTAHHGDRPAHLAHHFDSPAQQFDAGKLGMWVFLVTEILLFGGLFCWYAVYRANFPEIFAYGHRFLDVTLGGINTVVLITSSVTMALAVRAAQTGNRRALLSFLAATLFFACCFLGIKFVEYQHKWKDGLLWGASYRPVHGQTDPVPGEPPAAAPAAPAAPADKDAPKIAPAAEGPAGLATPGHLTAEEQAMEAPKNVHLFFGLYFSMTGLHGLHVIAGMAVILWLLLRARKGHFSAQHFLPVDLGGLYWHLVDVIWIFLFPLLYLIH